ncbi:MAG: DUF3800 domain-containing protein [Dehalococcoidia bacterium]
MSDAVNIYCDESGHLPNDRLPAMVLGAVWCPAEKAREIAVRLREIKARHGHPASFELKWSKVSPSGKQFYLDVIDYFFDDDDLHARALVVPDKSKLDHERFNQDHDTWYYKMYFELLHVLLKPDGCYRIYVDIKDTKGARKVAKLHDVLANSVYDFRREIVERVQTVRSHEVEQLQLADLIIGAVGYANRGLTENAGKVAVVERIRKRSGYELTRSTLLREEKLNVFRWRPQGAHG